jgi:hypothetical protein
MPIYCCDQIKNSVVELTFDSDDCLQRAEIYGKPDFANDGDGHFDDMTDMDEISYCPYCGTKLT